MGLFHSSCDVKVEMAFFFRKLMARGAKKLSNNVKLFRVSEAMWVITCSAVDMLTAADPYGVGVVPE